MKLCYVTIKDGHRELLGYSNELSTFISFDDFIKMVSQPTFVSLTIEVSNDSIIPDREITLMKV